MEEQQIPYERCVLVCVNDSKGEKPSCGDHGGEEIFRYLREAAKAAGVHPRVRVTQAKCLGQCGRGVNVMVYPDNVWISGVRRKDCDDLVKNFLK